VTHLRKKMLEELQGRKSLPGWVEDWVARSDIRAFGVVESSPCSELLRSFGGSWAPFFVADSLMQDQPDQSTQSVGDCPDGLIVPEA